MRFEKAKCSDTSPLQHLNSGQTSNWRQGQKLYTDMTLLGAGISALSSVKPDILHHTSQNETGTLHN